MATGVPPKQPSELLWKWNETDVSQLQVAFDGIGGGGAALSVEAKSWGPALRLTWPTKASGNLATFMTVSDPALLAALAKDANDLSRYQLRFRVVGFSGTANEWYAVGPAFACNALTGGDFYGLSMGAQASAFGAGRLMRVQAGTLALSGVTPNWVNVYTASSPMSLFKADVNIKHAAASSPGFYNTFRHWSLFMNDFVVPSAEMSDAYWAANIGAFGAGWASETLNSCGLAVLGAAGTAPDQYFEFDNLCVLRNPMTMAV